MDQIAQFHAWLQASFDNMAEADLVAMDFHEDIEESELLIREHQASLVARLMNRVGNDPAVIKSGVARFETYVHRRSDHPCSVYVRAFLLPESRHV